MAIEIERKFLLNDESWKQHTDAGTLYRQGYIVSSKERTVRVRIAGTKAFLTIKGHADDGKLGHAEYEYEIPVQDATEMLDAVCDPKQIEKTRHLIVTGKHTWEIDVFHGTNEGLVIAEIELGDEHETFEKPAWIGKEVTGDPRYFNALLLQNPFSSWKNA